MGNLGCNISHFNSANYLVIRTWIDNLNSKGNEVRFRGIHVNISKESEQQQVKGLTYSPCISKMQWFEFWLRTSAIPIEIQQRVRNEFNLPNCIILLREIYLSFNHNFASVVLTSTYLKFLSDFDRSKLPQNQNFVDVRIWLSRSKFAGNFVWNHHTEKVKKGDVGSSSTNLRKTWLFDKDVVILLLLITTRSNRPIAARFTSLGFGISSTEL